MKYILHSLILCFLLPACVLHAMEDEDFVLNFESKEDNNNAANAATDNPLFSLLPPPLVLPPVSTARPSNILRFKHPKPNAAPAPAPAPDTNTNAANSKKRSNLFLSPANNKKSIFDLDDDDDTPPAVEAPPQPQPEILSYHMKKAISSITATLKRETLRKFTYDMECLQILDDHAYEMTMLCLQTLHKKDEKFLYNLGIKNGIPGIIAYIEGKKWYQFPENIVVRTKKYPHASPLASVAFCTEKRVNEQKNHLVNTTYFSPSEKDRIYKEIPSYGYLIEEAILTYLDPAKRAEQQYKNARKQLYSSENQ